MAARLIVVIGTALGLIACAQNGGAPESATAPVSAAPAPAQSAPSGAVAAPNVSAPPSTSPAPAAPRPATADDDIVVPGQTQLPPMSGDTRTNEERMTDIRAWDQCVMQAQGAGEGDPTRPQLTTPEEQCRSALGMSDRTSIPMSRSRRR